MFDASSGDRPYPGLRAFEPWEGDIFFGRESHTDRLLEILREQHFLAVIGPSGSGKSSLVRAGLLPSLPLGAIGTGSDWRVAILRPGNRPIRSLADALLRDEALGRELEDLEPALLAAELREDPVSLARFVGQICEHGSDFNLLVVVDQFEEIFTHAEAGIHQSDESDAFVNLLIESGRVADQRVFIVLTMRTDFLGQCVRFLDLPEAINHCQYLTPRMTREQLHDAIRGPARLFGGDVDLALVEELINGVDNNPDQLPVLQHALARMWSSASMRNPARPVITRTDHEAIGGVSKALDQHADLVFASLDARAQHAAEWLFRALTTSSDSHAIVRRPCSMQKISRWSGLPPEEFRPAVEAFSDPDVCFLFVNGPLELPETVIDISHEALIRQWGRLKNWSFNEVLRATGFQRLQERANDYYNGNADLLTGIGLARADEWRGGGRLAEGAWAPTPEWCERYFDPESGLPDLAATVAYVDKSLRAVAEAARREEEEREREHELEKATIRADLESKARQLAEEDAAAQRRLKRRLSHAVIGLFVLLGLASCFAFVAYRNGEEARQSASEATIRRLSAESPPMIFGMRSGGPTLGMLQMLAANRMAAEGFPKAWPDALAALATEFNHGRRLLRVIDNDDAVTALAVSRDGKRIVTGSRSGALRLWDASAGTATGRPFAGHKERVNSVAFSPDGRRIVSASKDQTLRLWDAASGLLVSELLAGHGELNSVVFSPDGKRIVSGAWDAKLRLWDAATGTEIGNLEGHADAVMSVAFSPDGTRIVSGSHDRTLRQWDAETGAVIGEPLAGHADAVTSVAFSPDGTRIVSGSKDKTLRLWDAVTGEAIGEPCVHKAEFTVVAFTPDGKFIVSGGVDRFLRLWNAGNGEPRREPFFGGHGDIVNALAFTPDGKVVSGSNDRTLRIWNANFAPVPPVDGHEDQVMGVAFSPDGRLVATASGDKTLRLWDAASGVPIGEPFRGHDGSVNSVAFSPDGRWIASGSEDMSLRLWDVTNGAPVGKPFAGHSAGVNSVAFSADGKLIASASADDTLILWDSARGSAIRRLGPLADEAQNETRKEGVTSVAFSPDGKRLVAGSKDGTLRLWNVSSGKPIGRPLAAHGAIVTSVAFSHDGTRIVSGSDDRSLRIWDAASRTQIGKALQGHTGPVNSVAFSPDGRHIVSGGEGDPLRLWDAASGAPIGGEDRFRDSAETIFSVAFAPDGKRIAAGSADGKLHLVPVLEAWAEALCAKLGRNMTRAEWRERVSPDIPYVKQCANLPDPSD